MTRGERGFTIIETMAAVALLAILLGLAAETFGRILVENRLARDCAEDVMAVRRALSAIERDLREARGVTITAGPAAALEVATEAGPVVYRLRAGALERISSGRTAPLARNVEALDLERDGSLVRAAIRLGKRSGEAGRRAVAGTAVRLRAEGAGR